MKLAMWKPTNALRLALFGACAGMLAQAHPMGNFSINHYALIMPAQHSVEVLYVLDIAELPTLQLLQKWDLTRDSAPEALRARVRAEAREWASGLEISENGHAVPASVDRVEYAIQNGAGGLPVIRVNMHLRFPGMQGALDYQDNNFSERAGWKEIVIEARPGVAISKASPDDADRSRALTAYPQDPTLAPPQDTRSHVEWSLSAPLVTRIPHPAAAERASPQPPQGTPSAPRRSVGTDSTPIEANSLGAVRRNDFLSRTLAKGKNLSLGVALLCLCVAFGLGALHAIEPGHGKTMVAAYLVGSRGTVRQALFLGGMVTFTHTATVFVLGFVTLFLSRYLLPETLTKWLGVVSGVSIIWIGGLLLFRRLRKLSHAHDHHHHHDHPHGTHKHSHVPEGEVSFGSLVALGVSGGLVPCPAALVLLLSCISIGRPGLGLLFLISFSMGLALVLMLIGVMVLVLKNSAPKSKRPGRVAAWAQWAPVGSAAIILVVGVYMTGVALGTFPIVRLIG